MRLPSPLRWSPCSSPLDALPRNAPSAITVLRSLAALLNVFALWLITGWVWFEAYHRFMDVPEVQGGLMLTVGVIGLFVNIGAAWILHGSAEHSVNVEGAFRHVMAEPVGVRRRRHFRYPHLGLRVDIGRSHYQRGYRHPDPRQYLASCWPRWSTC